jgi:hypothetical protein
MHCTPVSNYLRKLIPDTLSRYVAAITAAIAIGVSIWWLQYTIQLKWIDSQHFPQQVVSQVPATSLPSFFEIAFTDFSSSALGNNSYFGVRPYWLSVHHWKSFTSCVDTDARVHAHQ